MKLIVIALIFAAYLALASAGGTSVSSSSPCQNTINSGQCLIQGQQIGSCNGIWIIIITADGWIIIIYVPTNTQKTIFKNEGKCNSVQLCVDEKGNIEVLCDGSKEKLSKGANKIDLKQNKIGGKAVLTENGMLRLVDADNSPSTEVDWFEEMRGPA